jgi:signal transduction histidine kinase
MPLDDLERGLLPEAPPPRTARKRQRPPAVNSAATDATSDRDVFLLQFPIDMSAMALAMIGNTCYMLTYVQRLTVTISPRIVALCVVSVLVMLIFKNGARAYLQRAVRCDSMPSVRGRVLLIISMLLDALIFDLIAAFNYGAGPDAHIEHTGPLIEAVDEVNIINSFLFYLVFVAHAGMANRLIADARRLSRAESWALLAATLLSPPLLSKELFTVYINVLRGLPPFHGHPSYSYDLVAWAVRELCTLASALFFLVLLHRFNQAHNAARELAASRRWSAFMFHELRNPLNGTVGHLELAQATITEATQEESYSCASSSAPSAAASASSAISPRTVAPRALSVDDTPECGGDDAMAARHTIRSSISDALVCTQHALAVLRTLKHLQGGV